MKKINVHSWNRKEHYEFFSKFDEPFYGLVAEIDCTRAYLASKENGRSFFSWYLHKSLLAVNAVEEFRLRIVNKEVVLFDEVHASTTIGREDGTFAVTFVPFSEDFGEFLQSLNHEIEEVQKSEGLRLNPEAQRSDVIHYSSIPWIRFTGMTHPRKYHNDESEPKISFGKIFDKEGRWMMPVSVFAHHGFIDGIHMARYFDLYQKLMDE